MSVDYKKMTDDEIKAVGDEIGVDWDEINFDQFKQGCLVEMEHDTGDPQTDVVDDPLAVAQIALKHLQEVPDYYTELKKFDNEDAEENINDNEDAECDDCDSCDNKDEDVVEFKQDIKEDESDESESKTQESFDNIGNMPGRKIMGGGLLRLLQSIVPLVFKLHNEEIPEETDTTNPFDYLSDDDFDDNDEIVKHFKNDLGGCKGIVKIIKVKSPDAIEQYASILDDIHKRRTAAKLQKFRKIYSQISLVKQCKTTARSQVAAVNNLEELAKDADDIDEHRNLLAAKDAVLAGTCEYLDAAMYRVKKAFALSMPKTNNIRLAYTTLRTQDGEPYMLCPKARHQIGQALPIEISKCRENCIDSKIAKDGKVTCAYSQWLKLADNEINLNDRLEEHKHHEDGGLLTLAKDERSKTLTKDERTYEERMEEDIKRPDIPDESIEQQLDDAKEANLGHHGEPEKSVQEQINKTASKSKGIEIDADKDETMEEQIEKVHREDEYDDVIEALLNDERVIFDDNELDILVENLLEKTRK